MSALALHAVLANAPASQVAHVWHCPPALENVPGGQLPHSVAPGPKHVAHAALHGAHTVSASAEHAVAAYVPAAHCVHVLHSVPSRHEPALQLAQSVGAGPVHVAHVASHAVHTVFVVAVHAVAS